MRTLTDFDAWFSIHSLEKDPIQCDALLAEEVAQVLFGFFDGIAENVTVNVIPKDGHGRGGGPHFLKNAQPFKDLQ